MCFYEPFNESQAWLTRAAALRQSPSSWPSRHSPTDPYYLEYLPLIKEGGGILRFEPAMTMQWFIPLGGLRGELRSSEKEYLSLLIAQADRAGKVPVFGGWRSLGRAWAIKETFGGLNVFQYRNLWQQWTSLLSYKTRGDMPFYVSVVDTVFRGDDPYFSYLVDYGLKHAARSPAERSQTAMPATKWVRRYPNVPRDEAKVRRLELLPDHQAFAMFMGLHIYLYLHAQLSADMTADVTRMARDERYRSEIERAIWQRTGLEISFADVADLEGPAVVAMDPAAIDWDEIREHAKVAVRKLSSVADPDRLMLNATEFIENTIDEIRKGQALPPC